MSFAPPRKASSASTTLAVGPQQAGRGGGARGANSSGSSSLPRRPVVEMVGPSQDDGRDYRSASSASLQQQQQPKRGGRELAQFSNPERVAMQYLSHASSRSPSEAQQSFPPFGIPQQRLNARAGSVHSTERQQQQKKNNASGSEDGDAVALPPHPSSLSSNPYIRAGSSEAAVKSFISAHYDPYVFADVASGRRSSSWAATEGSRSRSRSAQRPQPPGPSRVRDVESRQEEAPGDGYLYVPPASSRRTNSLNSFGGSSDDHRANGSAKHYASHQLRRRPVEQDDDDDDGDYRSKGASAAARGRSEVEDEDDDAEEDLVFYNGGYRSRGRMGWDHPASEEDKNVKNLLCSPNAVFETSDGDRIRPGASFPKQRHQLNDTNDDGDSSTMRKEALNALFLEVMQRFYEAQDELWRPRGRHVEPLPSLNRQHDLQRRGEGGDDLILASSPPVEMPPSATTGGGSSSFILIPADEWIKTSPRRGGDVRRNHQPAKTVAAAAPSTAQLDLSTNGSAGSGNEAASKASLGDVPATLSALTFTCGKCGAKRSSGNFCGSCGGSLPQVVLCGHCGAQFRGKFCNFCGHSSTSGI